MVRWEKLSHLEHVLKRPDSYVGSVKPDVETSWVVDSNSRFVRKNIVYAPALLKIFDEILVNALDQHALHPGDVNKINVSIDADSGAIRVSNNGNGIPVVKHDTENVYIPELIFGTLLTSSNYDDSEARTTGGRNGYGSKLTNIYSKHFEVLVKDPINQKQCTWSWCDNMKPSVSKKPTSYKGKEGEVTITFIPDWKRFGMSGLTDDIIRLFEKRVWDTAICQSGSLKVTFNGTRVPVKSLKEYALLHDGIDDVVAHSCPRWDVVVGSSNHSGFRHVSFVNGICTTVGGTHVDSVASMISKDIIAELVKKKVDGASKLKPMNVKSSMFLFVRSTIVNPSFSSQIKAECTTKASDFGSSFSYPPKFLKSILDTTGIKDELESVARFKEQKDLKKSDGSKKNKIKGIPKLDDANWAGTAKSAQCTLIVTEGDSAKALAISGLSVIGRDKWGVFPLRGKPKNVRDSSVKQLMNNQEFSDLKQILGLQQEKVYTSLSELRYGRIMIMTDADLDGSHIKGLVLNMIHCFWPSLLKLNFVVSMVTPIIKVGSKQFFTDQSYRAWLDSNGGQLPRGAKVKYYKGLGTSTSTEAKEYFKKISKLTVGFTDDSDTGGAVVLAFDKSRSHARKQWLENHLEHPREPVEYGDVSDISIYDFIHRDLVNFSMADVTRSIPHMVDGLKPSQRKVMFGCLKRKLTSEIKVAQLSGYISEVSAYHHGEASLQGAIIGMAHNYMGSNNINLLEPCGQFGTRLMGGKDAASSRYIFTRLTKDATKIFDPRDNNVLTYMDDDGKPVEPEFYVPVIPMVLVNGAEGIGTGYSTTIPCYNPDDIKANLMRCMKGEAPVAMKPWYRGFKGTVEDGGDGTWILTGCYKKLSLTNLEIFELPPGKWTQDYKEFLDGLVDKGKIHSYSNHSTEEHPCFKIIGYMGKNAVKDLGLSKRVHTTNMWLRTPNGLKKYSSPEEILVDFFAVRLGYYKKRKARLLKEYKFDSEVVSNKAHFVQKVVDGVIRVFRRKRVDIEVDLVDHGLKKVSGSYDYLMNIKTDQYTSEKIESLLNEKSDKERLYSELSDTSVITLWENDLKL